MIARLLAAALLLLTGCTAAIHGASSAPFALLGDVPYTQAHANILEGMIDEINREHPAFVVHLGDITGGQGPCTDAWFEARARQFARFTAPFVLVPGDNEWTDCHRSGRDPLERLAKVRQLFNSRPVNLDGFTRQSAAWPEHVRWTYAGALFVALNVPGSNNNLGRAPAMDEEYAMRMKAVLAWLDEAVAQTASRDIRVLVVMMQANPLFEATQRLPASADGYAELRARLEAIARTLGKPLVVAHGDTHRFKHDHPIPGAPGAERIEVDGWPWLGWLRVEVAPGASFALTVERRLSQ